MKTYEWNNSQGSICSEQFKDFNLMLLYSFRMKNMQFSNFFIFMIEYGSYCCKKNCKLFFSKLIIIRPQHRCRLRRLVDMFVFCFVNVGWIGIKKKLNPSLCWELSLRNTRRNHDQDCHWKELHWDSLGERYIKMTTKVNTTERQWEDVPILSYHYCWNPIIVIVKKGSCVSFHKIIYCFRKFRANESWKSRPQLR